MPTTRENFKDQDRVAVGIKAARNNPRFSDETRERAEQKIEEMGFGNEEETMISARDYGDEQVEPSGFDNPNKNEGNVLGGYKATLKNPRVSDEAKQRAEQILKEHGAL